MIMDRSVIQFDKELNSFVAVKNLPKIKAFFMTDHSNYYLNTASILEELSNKIIYPLPALREFVENGFQTDEQSYNNRQMKISRFSILIASLALLCSAAPYIVQLIKLYFKC